VLQPLGPSRYQLGPHQQANGRKLSDYGLFTRNPMDQDGKNGCRKTRQQQRIKKNQIHPFTAP
jgi:hypothetical protein